MIRRDYRRRPIGQAGSAPPPNELRDGDAHFAGALRWSPDRALYSRLNDKRRGAIVIVMQRLHEDDLPERVIDIWWAAFRQQYNAGGYLNACMHPFQSGRALRISMLDRLITPMKTLPGVWFPTCEQVPRHCQVEPFRPR